MSTITNGTTAVLANAVAITISGTFAASYQVGSLTTDWMTECMVSSKTPNSFVVTFSTPAPAAGGNIDWIVVIPDATTTATVGLRPSWKNIKLEATRELRARTDKSARLEVWLREAYLEVAYGFRFYEMETSKTFILSVAASEIPFSTIGANDVKHILSLRDTTNGRKLSAAPFRYIDTRTTGDGAPTHYCRYSSSILFDSKPSGSGISYRLRYRKQISEPDFTSDTSYPETPQEWDEIIRLKAVARGFSALFEPDMALEKTSLATYLISVFPVDEFVESEDQAFGLVVRNN